VVPNEHLGKMGLALSQLKGHYFKTVLETDASFSSTGQLVTLVKEKILLNAN
jgi:hypothetical protein